MHIRKRLLFFALAVIMVTSMGGTALATDITPLWENVSSCNPVLTFSGTTANCKVTIRGESGTVEIDPKITLQKESSSGSFSAAASWDPAAVSSASFSWSGTKSSCVSGANYRLKVEADVTCGDTTETIVVYSTVKTCP